MLTALAIFAAVVVIGLLAWRLLEKPKPGQQPLDNQGRPTTDKRLDPSARHNDALGSAIGDAVSSLYRVAANW